MNSISLVKPKGHGRFKDTVFQKGTLALLPNNISWKKSFIQLLNTITINSYLEERCSGLFRSFRSVKKEESHFKMLFRSRRKEVLKYQLPYHQISQRTVQRLLCLPLHKTLLQSWENLSDRGVMKDIKKDRHIKFLQFVKNHLLRKYIITHIISFSKIFAVLNTLLKPKQV